MPTQYQMDAKTHLTTLQTHVLYAQTLEHQRNVEAQMNLIILLTTDHCALHRSILKIAECSVSPRTLEIADLYAHHHHQFLRVAVKILHHQVILLTDGQCAKQMIR